MLVYLKYSDNEVFYYVFSAKFLTFGTNTKHNVIVVQEIINRLKMINAGFGLSFITKDMAAPDRHIITTL